MKTPKVRWRLYATEEEPTSRERGANVYRELRRQGWDAGQWDGREAADIIVLQYSMRDLEAAQAAAPVVVADINDMVFQAGHPHEQQTRAGLGEVAAVVAGSPRLGQHLERLHPLVRMIEQPVGPQYWTVQRRRHEGVHVFWMGMHDNIVYFDEIDGVLGELAERLAFTVHFCTSRRSNLDHADGHGRDNVARVAAKPYPTVFHEWSVEGAVQVMGGCDVGVAPLWANEWCWCKCANKAVNMMAGGLAVVASDMPAYRAVIAHGESGWLCWGETEWREALGEALGDAGRRREVAAAGKVAAQALSVETIAGQWAALFEEVG